jgi:hypothetical protein
MPLDTNEQLTLLQMNGATLGAEAIRSMNTNSVQAGNMAALSLAQQNGGVGDDPGLLAALNAADRTPQGGR